MQCAGVAWAYYADEDLLGLFLDCVNLNAVNPSDGRTALLCAATSGRIDHCALLTEHGADINVADAVREKEKFTQSRYLCTYSSYL